jgi:hypothetical protein
MDFSCFGVSGCASGSAFAAAVMRLSSCAEGNATDARLDTFDIVLHLSTIGSAQAYDPSHLATIYKGHVVEDLGFLRERYHAQLAVFEAIIDPNQRGFPIELDCQRQGDAVLCLIRGVFGWIELNSHSLL